MSAFMCSAATFDVLVSAAVQLRVSVYCGDISGPDMIPPAAGDLSQWVHGARGGHVPAFNYAAELWRLLAAENIRSLAARYEHSDPAEMWEGMTEADPETGADVVAGSFREPHPTAVQAVTILKACDCYEYQACESEQWDKSLARAFVQYIRRAVVRTLPGYDVAPGWDVPEEVAHPAPRFISPVVRGYVAPVVRGAFQ